MNNTQSVTERGSISVALNKKQEQFIKEYVKSLNATQSAIKAGYSENGARVTGHRLLANINIKKAIEEQMEARAKDAEVDTVMVLENLKQMVFDNKVLPKDKLKALDLLGRYHNMWSGEADKNKPTTITVRLHGADTEDS